MSVVAFERAQETGMWSERELNTIVAALQAALAPSTGREWETGATESGDAQFYLLGPRPPCAASANPPPLSAAAGLPAPRCAQASRRNPLDVLHVS